MRVVIVEPHCDDAWLDLGGAMLAHPQHDYTIVSISGDTSTALASHLPRVSVVSLGLPNVPWDEIHAEVADPEQHFRAAFLRASGLRSLAVVGERVARAVVGGCDLACLPLGLLHPLHVVISELALPWPTCHYREYPYAFFDEESGRLAALTADLPRTTIALSEAIAATKLQIFHAVYAAQRAIAELPEVVALGDVRDEVVYGAADGVARWVSAR